MNHPKLKQKIGLTEMMTHMERITATVKLNLRVQCYG